MHLMYLQFIEVYQWVECFIFTKATILIVDLLALVASLALGWLSPAHQDSPWNIH